MQTSEFLHFLGHSLGSAGSWDVFRGEWHHTTVSGILLWQGVRSPPPFLLYTEQRQRRSSTQDIIPSLHNIIFQYTNPFSFETEPEKLSETELLPFIINNTNKHVHYKDLLSFNKTRFELITFDTNFIIEHSETSDNRPYANPNFTSQASPDEHNPHISQHYTGQNISHNNQDDTTELLQNQETTPFTTIPDSFETATIQNA